MSALHQRGQGRTVAEAAEPLPRPASPRHADAPAEPSPVETTPPAEERRFLMILLRALSAWST